MDQPKASVVPARKTFEDFDPLTGGADLSKDGYYQGTFHTSDMEGGDPVFSAKANQMGSVGGTLMSEADGTENATDKEQQARTKAQTKEAAL